jgi:hypothetical protein
MNRKAKLTKLLDIAPPLGADLELPEMPPRFIALEQDDDGRTLCFYVSDSLDELRHAVASSETRFVEEVRVHDLDEDTVLAPVWSVTEFAMLEDEFSYDDGYVTIR